MKKFVISIIVASALAVSGIAAADQAGAGQDAEAFDVPTPRLLPAKAFVTAHELANPELYYPSFSADYVPPGPEYLGPPPENPVRRPGEFEEMDSVVITVMNYGSAYFPMWRDMVDVYAEGGHTYIVIDPGLEATMTNQFDSAGISTDDYTYLNYPHNSIWIRDYGPEFMVEEDGFRHVFDADYSHRPLDDNIPVEIANSDWINEDGSPLPVHETDHMLSGGNIATDGMGTCFFSNILYGYEKPAGWSNEDVDALMRDYLGCEQIVSLNPICLDGTGHVDLYFKVMDHTSVLLGEFPSDTYFDGTQSSGETYGHCTNPGMPNDYQDQEDNLAIIQATTNLDGEAWQITRLVTPEPYQDGGYWVYRSYMNSQIFNGHVAMPSYYDPQNDETAQDLLDMEAEAIEAYEESAPGVNVVPIDADHIIPLAGAFHCITHEVPSAVPWPASDADADSDSDADAGADGGDDGGDDDGCGCNAPGSSVSTSLLSVLFG